MINVGIQHLGLTKASKSYKVCRYNEKSQYLQNTFLKNLKGVKFIWFLVFYVMQIN